MDFLDPDKKRKHSRRLYLGYILIAIAIATASVILLYVANGFDVDRKTGQVIQNGLIFVNAHPESATVYVNGKDNGKTDARLTLPADEYNIELRRDGYRTWKTTLNLEGSSIERLTYPFLFPEKLSPKDLQVYDATPILSTQSPDRRWVLVQETGPVVKFDSFDTSNPKTAAVVLAMPANVLTASKEDHGLSLVEWSTDNRHVVLKHSYATTSEFILFDRETPAASVNLSKQLVADAVSISLRDKKYDQYYLFDEKNLTLKTTDLKNKTPVLVANGVTKFKPYKSDTILYTVKDPADTTKFSVHLRDSGKDYVLASLPSATAGLLDLAEYDSHNYVVVGSSTTGKISVYRDPVDSLKQMPSKPPTAYTVLRLDKVTNISFSATAQFLAAQQGSHFVVHDFEANRLHSYEIPLTIPADNLAKWMDGHRLLINSDSKLVVFDFNGINLQQLVAIVPGTKPFFDRDYTRLYTLSPSVITAGKTAFDYTSLKLSQQ